MQTILLILCAWLACGLAPAAWSAGASPAPDAAPGLVTLRPRESDEILRNPGTGFTSFNQPDGEMPRSQYPPCSIAYYRDYWDYLEPEPGKIQFDYLDENIRRARARGQRFAFRIMSANGGAHVPQWLLDRGIQGTWYFSREENTRKFMPDYSDPVFMQYARRIILALGRRYDGHPDLDHVDIGMVGNWGEWHANEARRQGYRWPPFEVRKQYIDWHFEAFPRTPLLMQFDDAEGLVYATQRGSGWRADGLGDLKFHKAFYVRRLRELKLGEVWKNAPVAFESFDDVRAWGRHTRDIFEYALRFHVSIFNGKSSPIPPDAWPAVKAFMLKMGYRLVLREVRFPARLRAGETFHLASRWENVGVAPPYRDYPLAYRLRSGKETRVTWKSAARLGGWLPGPQVLADEFQIPADLPPGKYQLEVAVLALSPRDPPLELAIEGMRSDGWYALSEIRVE